MKRRMLSLLLTLVMVLGMLPATTLTANAEMYIGVDTWEELVEELSTGDYGYIKLTADLKCSHEKGSSGHVKTVINGDKTLDLNGYTIECKDESNLVASGEYNIYSNKALFSVSEGATLTVNDSGTNGKIFYDGGMVGCSSYVSKYQYYADSPDGKRYGDYTERDIFDVDGTLIINDGTIQAGRKEKQWIFRGVHCDTSWTKYLDWNGNAQQQIWGTSVNVHSTGKLVVNGGNLSGRGMHVSENDPYCWPSYRDEVICIDEGGKAYINGGTFTGNGGADVFAGEGVDGGLQIRGGTFKTDKHDTLRVLDWSYKSAMGGSTETICPASGCGFYGHLGIPSSAYLHRQKIIINGKTYVGPFGSEIDLMKTGAVTHGWSEPVDDGKKMEVTFLPNAIDKLPVTLNGGPYSNYSVNDGQVIDWNVKSDNLVATVDYKPYFADTTGLKNAAPVYTWHLWGHYGTNGEVSKDVVTTTGRLDISAAWEEAAGTGNFRQMKVSCVVSEAPTNCTVRMETQTYEFRLKPTKTPLDESSLPGGEMEVDISYPAFSGLGSDIVVTVKPSAEDLADAAYGSSTVRYEYLYRDNMEEWEDEPHAWPHNTYNIPDADWGHVKIDVTMVVYGSDGLARRFTESAWALKLPDITVSGASLNSDKTAYVGNPGSPVTLKAPIDVTNADIAADKIKASDIAGLYRITYDNSGKPVMSLVTAGSYTQYQVTGNGTYCYAAYDRDGNLVYSKPVKVEFNAEAYGISITKSNDFIFTVYNNGSVVMPLTITATYGSSVSLGNIRWAIQSYPQGMSTSDFTYVNAHGKSAISFEKLFKDVKTIVPGNYLVMAYVVKDGQYLTASNCVTVEVGRIADFVDITDEAGNVISGKTMEGPYVGNTMKLNCVPGNGASAPSVYTVDWKVESLVGTNVATIDNNGVLTINKPGQIKVTATATVGVGQTALANNTQTVIINIPITEVEVTLGTPTIGGDPDAIASVPADAPYELVYNPEYNWASGVHPGTGKFGGNLIPKLRVDIVPKDGYVFPARQTDLAEYGDETWFTYADDITVKVNGTSYNFRDFAETFVDGYTEYGKDYDGTFYEEQEIKFMWTWDRLRSASDTYLDYVNLSVGTPAVGDVKDTSAFNLACSNNAYANEYSFISSVYKVSGDNLKDNDTSNDNAVSMATGETYAKGQMYRVTIMVQVGGPYASPAQYFDKQVIAMVNNEKCIIEPLTGDSLDGEYSAKVSYYFMPTAPIQTIENLYIDDLEAPVGYQKPASADDITEFYTNFAIDDEVYVTRLTWFYDVNNNGVIDTGEDSADSFNDDGSFIAGLRYSVYIELEARDRDDDGKGDFVKFADNAKIYLSSQSNAQMTGNQNGAVYKFPAATVPAKAVTTDPGQVTIELEEGYTSRPITTINVTSVGTTEITSITAEAEDSTLLQVNASGMSINVLPATTGIEKGTYRTSVVIKDNGGNVLTTVPVTITVGEPAASNITVNCIGDIDYTVSGNVVTVDHEVACKVGYLDGTAYKAITATANGDGTYSFTAPAGVTEVLLVVKGDVNGDGNVNTGDSGRLNAVNLSKVTLNAEQYFAADANGDNTVNTGDSGRLNAVNLNKTTLTW